MEQTRTIEGNYYNTFKILNKIMTKIEVINNKLKKVYIINVYLWERKIWKFKPSWVLQYSHIFGYNIKSTDINNGITTIKDDFENEVSITIQNLNNELTEVHRITIDSN